MSKFLGIGEKSYYVWKNKSHTELVKFLEQYFTEYELREYLDTGKMSKLENRPDFNSHSQVSIENLTHKIERFESIQKEQGEEIQKLKEKNKSLTEIEKIKESKQRGMREILLYMKSKYKLKTDKEVAAKLGVNYNTFKNWVNRDAPSYPDLIQFAKNNDIDLNEFL